MRRLVAVLVIGASLAGTANAQPPPPLPYPAVPVPRAEVVPPPPRGGYVWEPGHWHWNGRAYAWVGGHYVVRQARYGRYEPGHWRWAPRRGGWVWAPAHWG